MEWRTRSTGNRFKLGGFALVIGSALCYSTLSILGKVAFREGMTLTSILSTRFTIAAVALWAVILAVPGLRRATRALTGRRHVGLFLCGALGIAGQASLFFSSLQSIPASLTVVLLYTCPAFLAILLWIVTGRRPGTSRMGAIVLALSGTYLCAAPAQGGALNAGMLLGLAAGLWFAGFMMALHRQARGVAGIVSGAWIATGGACTFDLVAWLGGGYAPPPSGIAWSAVIGMVAAATVVGFVLFVTGIKRVGPQVASILSTFEPLGAILLASILLDERLAVSQWFGAALIIGAAFLLAALGGASDGGVPASPPLRDR